METVQQNKLERVIFIVGTTGVGKSKLSLDIAATFNGEIVNADSMQIYAGNDGIMTAKPEPEEKAKINHHLYDVEDMFSNDFNVNKYTAAALKTIKTIHEKGKIPIVVGGTNYYIEALLFNQKETMYQFKYEEVQFNNAFEIFKKEHPNFEKLVEDFRVNIPPDNKALIEEKYDALELHELLKIVDLKMSEYLHSNDKRRIVNALFKFFKYMPQSNGLIKESDVQQMKQGLRMRFLPIIIWMCADKEILEERIRKRVDDMIYNKAGLLEAVVVFQEFENQKIDIDFEKGILQAIGYKEFYDSFRYLKQKYGTDYIEKVMSKEFDEEDKQKIDEDKDKLISKTIQYSLYQIKWLNKRISKLFEESEDRI